MKDEELILTKAELNHQMFANMRPNLFILRASRGLSQKDAEKEVGLKPKRWEQLEQRIGKPALEELMLISQYFSIPMDDILYKKFKVIFI